MTSAVTAAAASFGRPSNQGVTLVHFSAQLKRFLWDRGCMEGVFRGRLPGVRGCWGMFRLCFCVRNGSG